MHVVFSTKERRRIIPPDMKERLWSYTAGICKRQKVFVHAIGGVEDHIHLLLQLPGDDRDFRGHQEHQSEFIGMDVR
jgi:putative transposase